MSLEIPRELHCLFDLIPSNRDEMKKIQDSRQGGSSLAASVAKVIEGEHNVMLNYLDSFISIGSLPEILYGLFIVFGVRWYTYPSTAILYAEEMLRSGDLPPTRLQLGQPPAMADLFEPYINRINILKGEGPVDFGALKLKGQANDLIWAKHWSNVIQTMPPDEFVLKVQEEGLGILVGLKEQLDTMASGLFDLSVGSLAKGTLRFRGLYQQMHFGIGS